ncbi:hypothetical protein QBC40DRAFT_274301 [Triangularia verruculosa]|uniref:Small acidic protein-like domain-containing protein n=1 Tax=Triangularia verruculosa TaxID=2587418 RepID=A0AAN6XN16_9PEZI|nr:hypothetical protein QBC40DRAFT_274301 [Triangularia verruculosa]
MRLLGAKKTTPSSTSSTTTTRPGRLDINHVSAELEQQFSAGIRQKFETGGQKRGLGAA